MDERHPYHCTVCGESLREAGLGLLICTACDTHYVPTIDENDKITLIVGITYPELLEKQKELKL